MIMMPRETPPNDALDNEVVGRGGRSYPHSEVELPLRPKIDVDSRKELLLLIMQWIKTGQWSVRSVVLQTAGNPFGDVVTYFYIGRKLHSFVYGSLRAMIGQASG